MISGRYFRKLWSGIKTVFSFIVLAAIIGSVHDRFPDSYGENSLYDQAQDKSLEVSEVAVLLERGADINYTGEDGSNVLSIALRYTDDDLAIALIEPGADLTALVDDESPLAFAIYNNFNIEVIKAMLEHGASLDFTLDDQTPLEYSMQYENLGLSQLLEKYSQ